MKKLKAWLSGIFNPEKVAASGTNINSNLQNPAGSDINLPVTGIEWIDNDGLLRDEGVLFGIAGADRSEKLNAISNGFEKAKSPFEIVRRQILESIQEIRHKKEQSLANMAQTNIEILELRKNTYLNDHKFIPTFFQLLAYTAISLLNYFLVSFWMRPVFENNPYITIGIYCFGMLSVYMGRALVYNSSAFVQESDDKNNRREKWKIWLEEFGVPFVVATFITLLCARSYPIEWTVAAFLLFFFLFSFSGKGLINSIYRCHKECRQLLASWKQISFQNKEIRKKKNFIKSTESEIKSLDKKLQETFENLATPETKLSQLNALLAYKINIFESEYMLTSNAQKDFTPQQKASLQN